MAMRPIYIICLRPEYVRESQGSLRTIDVDVCQRRRPGSRDTTTDTHPMLSYKYMVADVDASSPVRMRMRGRVRGNLILMAMVSIDRVHRRMQIHLRLMTESGKTVLFWEACFHRPNHACNGYI